MYPATQSRQAQRALPNVCVQPRVTGCRCPLMGSALVPDVCRFRFSIMVSTSCPSVQDMADDRVVQAEPGLLAGQRRPDGLQQVLTEDREFLIGRAAREQVVGELLPSSALASGISEAVISGSR